MIFFSRKKIWSISNVYLSTADDLTEKIKQDITSTVPWKFPVKIGKIISAYKDFMLYLLNYMKTRLLSLKTFSASFSNVPY